jgi:hypothetical protein
MTQCEGIWPADEIEKEIKNPKPRNTLKEIGKAMLAFSDEGVILIILFYVGYRMFYM